MRLLLWIGGVALCTFWGIWWWRGREPPDRGSHVSMTWIEEHIRGRRD